MPNPARTPPTDPLARPSTAARSAAPALLVALAVLLLPAPAPAVGEPTTPRGPDGTPIQGFAADPGHGGVVAGQIGTRPRVLWRADVGIQGYYNNPLVVGARLVVSSYGDQWNTPDARDGVYVLRRTDGAVLHHLRTDSDANGVSTDGTRIFAVTDGGKVHAWELATGRTLWQVDPYATPALDLARMTPRQAFDAGHEAGYREGYAEALRSMGYVDAADQAALEPRLYGAPLVLAEGLLIAGAGGKVALLDPLTGATLRTLDGSGKVRNHSAADGMIAVATPTSELQVFDRSGKELYRWCAEGDGACGGVQSAWSGSWLYAAPAIRRGRIAVAGSYYATRQFALIDASNGRTLWSFGSPSEASLYYGGSKASPAITDNLVLFADTVYGDDGRLMAHALASGQRRWLVDGYGGSWSSPLVVGDKVVWVTVPGHLLILSLGTGEVLASVELHDRVFATPAIADGVIYVGGDSGQMYAVDTGFRR